MPEFFFQGASEELRLRSFMDFKNNVYKKNNIANCRCILYSETMIFKGGCVNE